MEKLVQGVHHFQNELFAEQKELFERLTTDGQSPETLFITCSDSRIDPNLLTQSQPGDLFIIRNAGNIVPPHGPNPGGTQATIEYAVSVIGVKRIIVCGHSKCGAMQALLNPESTADLPSVSHWLSHAEATRRIMKENYGHLEGEACLIATTEENVLNQIENLCTHPAVAARLARRDLTIHAWVYKIETGEVFSYNPTEEQFLPLNELVPVQARNYRRAVGAISQSVY